MKTQNRIKTIAAAVGTTVILAGAAVPAVGAATTNTNNYIGKTQAYNIALKDAGISKNKAHLHEIDVETRNGVKVYDVEFYVGNTEYDYDINAKTGAIVKKDKDIENFSAKKANRVVAKKKVITKAKAKTAALKHAGLAANKVTFTEVKLDKDDGVYVYDIEFRTKTKKYEYEINAANGTVREVEVKTIKTKTAAKTTAAAGITLAQAKQIALKKAGLTTAVFTEAKTDVENGVKVYELEFRANGYEYDCEINAKTGAVLDFDRELDD